MWETRINNFKNSIVLKISLNKSLSSLKKEIRLTKKKTNELQARVFFFNFKNGLNLINGEKIIRCLSYLNKNRINFKVINALPRCLFGSKYDEVVEKYKIPKSCNDCDFFFINMDNKFAVSCFGKKFDVNKILKKQMVANYINEEYQKLESNPDCVKCVYRLRNQCCEPCVKKKISDKIQIKKVDGLLIKKEKKSFFVIEPPTASWRKIDSNQKKILDTLHVNRTMKEIRESNEETILDFYKSGIIELNGKQIVDKDFFIKTKNPDYFLYEITFSNKCNLHCDYCFTSSSDSEVMHNKTLQKILDTVSILKRKNITIQFSGGEPLLHKDLIQSACDYLKSNEVFNKKNIHLIMQTNGTLINLDTIKFIKENNINIGISLDGPRYIQDRQRKNRGGESSFNDVMKGIALLKKHQIPYSVLAVITNPNEIEEIVRFFVSQKVRHVKFLIYFKSGRGRVKDFCDKDMETIGENLIKSYVKYGKKICIENLTHIINNISSRERKYMCTMSPCGAYNSFLSFDFNGDIYPCKYLSSIQKFRLGNVYHCKDINKLLTKSTILKRMGERRVDKIDQCKSCPIRWICGGGCTFNSYRTKGGLNKKGFECGFNKTLVKYVINELGERVILI